MRLARIDWVLAAVLAVMAVAVTACGGPSRAFCRRKKAPNAPLLAYRLLAARRKATAARLSSPLAASMLVAAEWRLPRNPGSARTVSRSATSRRAVAASTRSPASIAVLIATCR